MGYAAEMIGRAYHGSARGLYRALLRSQRACAGLGRRYAVVLPSCAERAGKTPPCLRKPAERGEEYISIFFTTSRPGEDRRSLGGGGAYVQGLIRTFATDDGADFCPSSGLRRLFDPLEGYTVPLWLLDPDIAVRLDVKRVKRAHLDMLVLLHDASRNLQRCRRFDGRRRRRISSS
jgi:hypothetical protein